MSLIAFVPAILLATAGTVLGQEARRRRTPAGVARERTARRTLAWWTRRFDYQRADFTAEGRRYWVWAQLAGLGALGAAGVALVLAAWHIG